MISVDSHVYFITDEWVTERLPERLRQKWFEGSRQYQAEQAEKRGDWIPDINDVMDPEAWNDAGHYEPHAKLKAMDRDKCLRRGHLPRSRRVEGLRAPHHGRRLEGHGHRLQTIPWPISRRWMRTG